MEQAYSNSTTLVFEADVGEVENLTNGLKLLKEMTLPGEETLQHQISAPVYEQFTNYLNEAGLPLFMVQRFKPTMAAMTIVMLECQKMGLDPEYGIDKYFYHRAVKDSKEVIGLETFEFQMNLLTGLSKEEAEAALKSTLEELQELKTGLGDIVEAWKTGDSDKLEKLLKEGGEEGTALNKKMITDQIGRAHV